MNLTHDVIMMNASAPDKQAALALMVERFVALGLIEEVNKELYLSALQTREETATTYLGAGIAIPHGTPDVKDKVIKTGVAVLHFADGLAWGDGQTAYVLVGIAAKSDEHLTILKSLTRALGEEEAVLHALKTAQTTDEVLAVLTGEKTSEAQEEVTLTQMLTLQSNAEDADGVAYQVADLLKSSQLVETGFLGQLLAKPWVKLDNGVWCVQSSWGVSQPALVLAHSKAGVTYQNQPLKTLVVLALTESVSEMSVSEALDVLLAHDLTALDKNGLLTIFGLNETKDWVKGEVFLANRHGLHARPATALAVLAKTYEGEIRISVDGVDYVSATSLSRLLALGANYGQKLYFAVSPSNDAEDCLQTLINAVQSGLGEEVVPIEQVVENATEIELKNLVELEAALVRGERIHGVGASKGLAVAQAYIPKEVRFEYAPTADDTAAEQKALKEALQVVKADIQRIIDQAVNDEISGIFTAHYAMLEDDELLVAVKQRIDAGASAAAAWHDQIEMMAQQQAALENSLLAQRSADLRDVGQRVLAALCGGNAHRVPDVPYILVKEDLLPSDVASLDSSKVLGVVTAFGGASSHSAIVARSLGIPAVVGLGLSILHIAQEERVLLHAPSHTQEGYLVVEPDEELVRFCQKAHEQLLKKEADAKANAQQPAVTLDNHKVAVMANLGDVNKSREAAALGAEGVGLLRTELVFMTHNKMPDEHIQQQDYLQVFDAMGANPVVVRTLDVGGDKPLPYLAMKAEDNPFLGVRGIRLTLRKPELLRTQLTALIQAANHRPLCIMFPMIARLEEWHAAKAILDEVLAEHPHNNLQVGMMIEVPSAAIMAHIFAKEVDFFSIGTNDLTQYTLAIDRGHPVLSQEADGLHPAVLRLIDTTVKAAHLHGKWVGVCGELGADAQAVPILLGLGVDELSVSASQIPMVKAQIRTLNFAQCRALATRALLCKTADAVRALQY